VSTEIARPASDELERLAVEFAEGAAAVVRQGRRDHMTITAKSTPTDVVTEVDQAAERWLAEQITARRADDAILGEEGGGQRRGTSGVRWVLDPIDGTVNFVLGLPLYAVSVAAELDGVVVAGAVSNPATRETFHARLGGGAYLGDVRLDGPRHVPLDRAVVGTGFSYRSDVRATQAAVVAAVLPQVGDVRRLGAASVDLCFLAAGRLDGYFEVGLNVWDFAAGGLVATEAGCVVSGLHDRPASEQMYAAAGPELAPSFYALLESLDADLG
jgi:myo-inositol-1(or 4)-monophosphatase